MRSARAISDSEVAASDPGRGHGIDTRRPVPEHVTYAVRRSSPPQHTLVVIGSPVSTWSSTSPAGRDDGQRAGDERRDHDVAVAVDAERVEQLHARAARTASRPPRPSAFCSTSPGPVTFHAYTRPVCVSAAYSTRAVGRQADAVRRLAREHDLADRRAVGLRVVDRAEVLHAAFAAPVIGEPHAAVRVEHDVVRADERVAVALGVEHLDVAAARSTRSMRPPLWCAGSSVSGMCKPMISWKSQPPLLQTYSAPSGPIAAPFGLPPGVGDRFLACRRGAPA